MSRTQDNALTEAEARDRWCPFATASHTDPRRGFEPPETPEPGGITYRDANAGPVFKQFPCIASRCMAWRWTNIDRQDHAGDRTIPTGVCGLAGGVERP